MSRILEILPADVAMPSSYISSIDIELVIFYIIMMLVILLPIAAIITIIVVAVRKTRKKKTKKEMTENITNTFFV